MAIKEFSDGSVRKRVAYLGESPSAPDTKAFIDRGYELVQYSEANLADHGDLSAADSVIFSQSADKPTKIHQDLQKYGEILLNYDCCIYVRVARRPDLQARGRAIVINALASLKLPAANLNVAERESIPTELREREGVILAPYVYVCDVGMEWAHIANKIHNNQAGKAPNLDLRIDATDSDGKIITLTEERELLVRRAFYDCAVVRLRQMADGLSGAPVYRSYVELAEGLFADYPFLYFLKLGTRQQVATEYSKYQGNALMYIPFHLGPRLNLERCGLGARDGVIVGDFVEEAEPLRDCACAGRAVPAIGNLFTRTLRAWHHASGHSPLSIPELLIDLFPTAPIPAHREPLIRALGAMLSLDEMRAMFLRRKSTPVLAGPIHGDLHATNVLVRSSDAIVTDFEKSNNGKPLVYDPASLEGGLLIDGFIKDTRDKSAWLKSILPLYEPGAIAGWTAPCHPNDASSWFYDCVRQIRIHGRQLECKPGQYATALALALVKKACNKEVFDDARESRRAAAYLLAERILITTGGKSGS